MYKLLNKGISDDEALNYYNSVFRSLPSGYTYFNRVLGIIFGKSYLGRDYVPTKISKVVDKFLTLSLVKVGFCVSLDNLVISISKGKVIYSNAGTSKVLKGVLLGIYVKRLYKLLNKYYSRYSLGRFVDINITVIEGSTFMGINGDNSVGIIVSDIYNK